MDKLLPIPIEPAPAANIGRFKLYALMRDGTLPSARRLLPPHPREGCPQPRRGAAGGSWMPVTLADGFGPGRSSR